MQALKQKYENFANYFLITKANNKCSLVLKCSCKGLRIIIIGLRRCETWKSTLSLKNWWSTGLIYLDIKDNFLSRLLFFCLLELGFSTQVICPRNSTQFRAFCEQLHATEFRLEYPVLLFSYLNWLKFLDRFLIVF